MEIHLYNDKGFSIAMFDEMGMEYKGVYMPCSSSIVEFTSLQVRKLFCTWRLGLFLIRGWKWSEKIVDKPWLEHTFISVEGTFQSVERLLISIKPR